MMMAHLYLCNFLFYIQMVILILVIVIEYSQIS